jgi:creatinine amidohydrolase/Fe(II)-dependent formamide hydrolase-like protein
MAGAQLRCNDVLRPRPLSSARSLFCALTGGTPSAGRLRTSTRAGTVGDATRATAALGARTAAHQAEACIALLTDVDAFDLTRLA